MERYVDRVCEELRGARDSARGLGAVVPGRVDTVYLGGGTPSLLQPEHLSRLFETMRGEFEVAADAEITLEAAPGQISDRTLDAALQHGVNRVSFGVQSFVDRESAAVGRLHTGAECLGELARMKAAGVGRLSLDLIVGLPLQTETSWFESLRMAIESGVEHVSVYMLEVDGDSRLGREAAAGGTRYHAGSLPDEDATADWYLASCERLHGAGLAQYEISNFSRPGFASRHNLKYWNRRPYLGFGLDAHSMLHCQGGGSRPEATGSVAVRWANGDDLDGYLMDEDGMSDDAVSLRILGTPKGVSAGKARTVERIDVSQAFEESLFLGLRLNEGVGLEQLRGVYGAERLDAVAASLRDVEQAGLVRRDAERIHLTAAGRLVSNEVFSRLLEA